MRLIIGLVASTLIGLGAATGATVALNTTAAPDKNVQVDPLAKPDPWKGAVNYGKP